MVPIFQARVHVARERCCRLMPSAPQPYDAGKRRYEMFRFLTPKSIRPPFAKYSHGIEVPAGKRLIVCSGQLGVRPDDSIPEDAAAQAELCFSNVSAVLAEAGLSLKDAVRINAYVTDRAHLKAYMDVRNRLVSD